MKITLNFATNGDQMGKIYRKLRKQIRTKPSGKDKETDDKTNKNVKNFHT